MPLIVFKSHLLLSFTFFLSAMSGLLFEKHFVTLCHTNKVYHPIIIIFLVIFHLGNVCPL